MPPASYPWVASHPPRGSFLGLEELIARRWGDLPDGRVPSKMVESLANFF